MLRGLLGFFGVFRLLGLLKLFELFGLLGLLGIILGYVLGVGCVGVKGDCGSVDNGSELRGLRVCAARPGWVWLPSEGAPSSTRGIRAATCRSGR